MSGEIIQMGSTMSMMFEPADLGQLLKLYILNIIYIYFFLSLKSKIFKILNLKVRTSFACDCFPLRYDLHGTLSARLETTCELLSQKITIKNFNRAERNAKRPFLLAYGPVFGIYSDFETDDYDLKPTYDKIVAHTF